MKPFFGGVTNIDFLLILLDARVVVTGRICDDLGGVASVCGGDGVLDMAAVGAYGMCVVVGGLARGMIVNVSCSSFPLIFLFFFDFHAFKYAVFESSIDIPIASTQKLQNSGFRTSLSTFKTTPQLGVVAVHHTSFTL